jgi:hypothetical protein
MKRVSIIILVISLLMLSGCTNSMSDNVNKDINNSDVTANDVKDEYVSVSGITPEVDDIVELVSANDNVVCEFKTSSYETIKLLCEKFKNGKLIKTKGKSMNLDIMDSENGKFAVVSNDCLGFIKLSIMTNEINGNKQSCNCYIDITDELVDKEKGEIKCEQSFAAKLEKDIAIEDNEIIIFFKDYEFDINSDAKQRDISSYTNENLKEYDLCYRVKVIFE